jgi:hypothetical protein
MAAPAGFLPTIGAADEGALAWINSVLGEIPDEYRVHRQKMNPVRLRELIRDEADAIEAQAPFRAFVVGHVELATGQRYTPVGEDAR